MMDIYPELISGLVGAAAGAAASTLGTVWFSTRQSRISKAFEFHREINSESMMKNRTDAQRILGSTYPVNLATSIKNHELELHPIWVITGFYDRLQKAIEHKDISRKKVSPFFGELFCFFYYGFLEKQLYREWDLWKTFGTLENQLKLGAEENWEEWKKKGIREADEVILKSQPNHQRRVPALPDAL